MNLKSTPSEKNCIFSHKASDKIVRQYHVYLLTLVQPVRLSSTQGECLLEKIPATDCLFQKSQILKWNPVHNTESTGSEKLFSPDTSSTQTPHLKLREYYGRGGQKDCKSQRIWRTPGEHDPLNQ